MSIRDFPLDIVPSILDELSNEPSPKPLAMQALRACSLTCRAWRPIAQQRLLKKVSLLDPTIQHHPETKHPCSQQSFKQLLDTIRDSSDWVAYVRVLHIFGLILDPEFPEILDTFAKAGLLRTFRWHMPCSAARRCIHWYNYPQGLRTSVEAVLSSPRLTSVRLHSICGQFPMEILGYSPLKYLELTNSVGFIKAPATSFREPADVKTQVEYLHLENESGYILEYYKDRKDFRLDFSRLKELSVMHVKSSFTQRLLDAAEYLNHFSARYWSEWDDGSYEPDEDDPLNLSFRSLSNLRVVTINIYHDFNYDMWSFYNHLLAIAQILEHSRLPNTLETLNLAIRLQSSTGLSEDNLLPGPLPSYIQQSVCDSKLADMCLKAKSGGRFRKISLRFLISGRTEAMEYFRRHETQWSEGVTTSQGEKDLDKAGVGPSDSEMEGRLSQDCDLPDNASRADILGRYPSYKNLPCGLENTFPLLRATGMLHLEVLDHDEYYMRQSSRDIW